MATWPSTLPAPSPGAYQEVFPNNTIRSDMEVGPAKVRKRATSAPTKYKMSFEMDNTDINTLETFYRTTINEGADTFEMDDPRNGTTETFRMIGPPEISALSPIYYRANINMEKLP